MAGLGTPRSDGALAIVESIPSPPVHQGRLVAVAHVALGTGHWDERIEHPELDPQVQTLSAQCVAGV